MTTRQNLPYIFLFGRPGCGKSAIFRILTDVLENKMKLIDKSIKIDDFPILQKLLDADTEFKRHERKEGGFAITDWSIADDVLKEMNLILKKEIRPRKAIFVEFARDNYTHALSNFEKAVLNKSLILYILCSYETCNIRNVKRFELRKDQDPDDHIVPSDIMASYYRTDDIEPHAEKNAIPENLILPNMIIIDNNPGKFEEMVEKHEEIIEYLKNNSYD